MGVREEEHAGIMNAIHSQRKSFNHYLGFEGFTRIEMSQ